MTTTYKIKYRWNGGCMVSGVVDAERLAEVQANPRNEMVECAEYTPTINYRTAPDCERCTTDEYVPHYNCIYGGKAAGHSASHCTADSCY